jgi:hypothetical protein
MDVRDANHDGNHEKSRSPKRSLEAMDTHVRRGTTLPRLRIGSDGAPRPTRKNDVRFACAQVTRSRSPPTTRVDARVARASPTTTAAGRA